MCGIYGIIQDKNSKIDYYFNDLEISVKKLYKQSLSRGSEAAGLLTIGEKEVNIIKTSENATSFISSPQYNLLKKKIINKKILAILGHTRMATHGTSENNINNQPVIGESQKIIGVHNGLIANYEELLNNEDQIPELDTQVLVNYLEKKISKQDNHEKLKNIFNKLSKKIEGVANLALVLPKNKCVLLYSNNGSLYYLKEKDLTYFASEAFFLERIFHKHPKQIKNELVVLDLQKKSNPSQINNILIKSKKNLKKQTNFTNNLKILQKHDVDEEKIEAIKRCVKCILPATTPFISFDGNGVCNYCLEHQKIKYFGINSLEKILSKHRSKNGKADCLVAFSGGRDSSYGLHLIKKELGMNPISFTYDWGMISDLGRRNQSKILGKLGVEQILVSANIAKKRQHIRQNILAWLKKPELGMVPLFMQGDKQCEYYADQVMKKCKIPLMIYCRGNELEKEEFKAGYCGVKEADPGGVMHNLSLSNKLRLLNFYGKQYLLNPSYINGSIVDAAFGYFATYLKPHNYLYLWHYLPWEENKIVKTLTEEYDWELSLDTPTSWRIGDGTPAFYNYIYYQIQGFTENDSFRARQVREGILSREKAIALVKEENKPQYQNLKWYFDTLNLDGDKILSAIDKMKKKYDN